MKLKTLPLVLFSAYMITSQQAHSQQTGKKDSLHLVAKFYPLALGDLNFPTIQPGIELRNNHWGVQLAWGFNNNYYTMQNSDSNHRFIVSGTRLRLELRKYLSNKKQSVFTGHRGIVLFTTSYYKQMDRFEFHDHEAGKNYQFDHGTVHKDVYGMAYSSGGMVAIGKRTSFEFSTELGVRLVKTSFTNFTNLQEIEGSPRNSFDTESSWQGTKIRPHLGLTIGITYRLF